MLPGAHRIRRLTWLVRTPATSSAFALRQALRNELESVLLPTLERVFDQFAPGDRLLRISRLSLKIDTESGTTEDLARRIEEQLHSLLTELVRGAAQQTIVPPESAHNDRNTRHDAQQLSVAEHRRELLIGYLRGGRIGWAAIERQTPELLAWLRTEAERLVAEQPGAETVIAGTLDARIAISFRLLQLLAPSTRASLLQDVSLPREEPVAALVQLARNPRIGSDGQLRVAAVLVGLRDQDLPNLRRRSTAEIFAALSLPQSIVNNFESSLAEIGDARQERTEPPADASRVSPTPLSHPAVASDSDVAGDAPPKDVTQGPFPMPERRAAAVAGRETDPPHFAIAPQRAEEVATPRETPGYEVTASNDRDAAIDEAAWRAVTVKPPAAADRPGLLACDAGLILLHPFLPRLLEATGIASSGRRLPFDSLPRAAALLHWLATGRQTVYEFELCLCKVLLGLTPADPLPVSGGLLSDDDRDEGDALLAAVIEHWSALRQTSTSGLRTSFLERRGILRDDDAGWRLRLETESFDVLLGQLPWGITVVKLPWMTKPIFTDWPTP